MVQTPLPSVLDIPFDWNMFVNNTLAPIVVTVIVGVGLLLAFRVIMRSPVGEAWAERVRQRTNKKYGDLGQNTGEQQAQLEAVHDQMGRIEASLAELTERIDFTERVLAKQRDPDRIGPAR